ncbi:hypothetical protein BGZ58_008325 [Dissophora ornata]|nr:hypothetical protein BGZ58_008325 [Dissophora ornata]
MAPPGTQPAPAPQKRDLRAGGGMTKVQLTSQAQQPQSQAQAQGSKKEEKLGKKEQVEKREDSTASQVTIESPTSGADLGKRSTRRRNGGEALMPSQFAAPSTEPSTPFFMRAFQDPSALDTTATADALSTKTEKAKDQAEKAANDDDDNDNAKNTPIATTTPRDDYTQLKDGIESTGSSAEKGAGGIDIDGLSGSLQPAENDISSRPTIASTVSSPARSLVSPSAMTDINQINSSPTITTNTTSSSSMTAATLPPIVPTTPQSSTAKSFLSVFDQRPPMSPRRHTTSSSQSLFSPRHDSPPVPLLPQQHQPMSLVNPTLRQLQTPQIPTNLVQARILQQEEQKRRDEELAKIPITANLRTVKKIQAVLVDDEEDVGNNEKMGLSPSSPPSSSSSPSSSLRASPSRPRAKTVTSSMVTVSTLTGGKQRGDRNHVEPVAIPKKLAEQVEHILGRKLAGKGSVLDEREKEREEEEVRKAAEPLPPIVRGQPRKRALTSTHIRNLVSSWDHKVEEAKEITSEAEQIRQFLETRSTAHAELPKFSKVLLSGSELLKPLPSLPPPPPSTGEVLGQSRKAVPSRVGGHSKAASSASPYMSSGSGGSSSSLLGSSTSSLGLPAKKDTTNAPAIVVEDECAEDDATKKRAEATRRLATLTEIPETKRSGQVLDNKAVMTRPRRAGARRATTTATLRE